MALTYDPIFAADPNNSANVAANAAIVIFDPADAGKAPITITDVTGAALPNPITVNKNGFGPAFQHATLDRVGWFGAGFTGYFTSYEGMKAIAVAAQAAAETAASTAGADAVAAVNASLSTAVASAGTAATDATSAAISAATSAAAATAAAGLVGTPADAAIAAAVSGTGATNTALNSTYTTAVNVRGYGVAVANTPAQNSAAFDAALAAAKSQKAALYIPPSPSGPPIQVDKRFDVSGCTVIGFGKWSHIQQTNGANGIFYTSTPDTTIAEVQMTTTSGRNPDDPNGTHCAIYVEDTAHRLTVRNIAGGGFGSLVNIPTMTMTLNTGLLVDGVEAWDVAFAVAGRALKDAEIKNVRGTYSQSNPDSAPPHLVYLAQAVGFAARSVNVHISDVSAWDGSNGEAVKVSGLDGGTITNIKARNCRGVMNILDVTDVEIDGFKSLDDNASSLFGGGPILPSVGIISSTRVHARGGRIKFKNIDHFDPVSTAGSTDCVLDDFEIECNLLNANTGAPVVKAYGTNNTYKNFKITSVGADIGNGFLASGNGIKIINPEISGNIKNGIYCNTAGGDTAPTVTYDPKNIKVKNALSGKAVWVDAASTARPILVTPAIQNAVPQQPLAYFGREFRGATDHDALTFWESGHQVTKMQAWQWDANGLYNTNGSSNAACTGNVGVANFEMEVGFTYGANTAGVALRKVDDNNFIIVGLQAGAIVIQSREAGVNTTVATVAATNTVGRLYTLRVAVYGTLIDVFLDGVKVLTYTLTAPQQTLFGAATAHGPYVSSSSPTRYRWGRIRSLV